MKRQRLLRIKDPVLLCGAYYWILARDATGILRMGLLAAVLHECGHIAAWLALTRRPPQIEVSLIGLCLRWQQARLSGGRLVLLAMAGPAVNLALAGGTLLALQRQACFAGYEFACCNLLLGIFNLLPLPPLDGQYLWLFIRQKLHFGSK